LDYPTARYILAAPKHGTQSVSALRFGNCTDCKPLFI
jgi:hypothetical protein